MKLAQRRDESIGAVVRLLESSSERPDWESVALKTRDVKVLWAQWPRLSMRGGLLKRRFEDAATGQDRWQIVMPDVYRQQFLAVAHGRMTGGHMSQKKTAAAVQSRAYWPSWSSDVKDFVGRCSVCGRCHRGKLPKGNYVIQRSQHSVPFVALANKLKRCFSNVAELESKLGSGHRQSDVEPLPSSENTYQGDVQARSRRQRKRPSYLNVYV